MYGQADVTKTFSGKRISNKSFSADLIKIAITIVKDGISRVTLKFSNIQYPYLRFHSCLIVENAELNLKKTHSSALTAEHQLPLTPIRLHRLQHTDL